MFVFIIIFQLLRATHLEGPAARSNIFQVFEHLLGVRTCSRCSNKETFSRCSGIAHVQSEFCDYCRRPRRYSLDRTLGGCSKTQYENIYIYIYTHIYICIYLYIYVCIYILCIAKCLIGNINTTQKTFWGI